MRRMGEIAIRVSGGFESLLIWRNCSRELCGDKEDCVAQNIEDWVVTKSGDNWTRLCESAEEQCGEREFDGRALPPEEFETGWKVARLCTSRMLDAP